MRLPPVLCVVAVLAALAPPGARAGVTALPVPSEPTLLAAGSGGEVWYAGGGFGGGRIARVTAAGAVQEFPIPAGEITGLTAGSDGNMWYTRLAANVTGTQDSKVGRVTPGGAVNEFDVAPDFASGLVQASDGNLYFGVIERDQVGRITPAGDVSFVPVAAGTKPYAPVRGSDGNVWLRSRDNRGQVVRVTPAGAVSAFTVPNVGAVGSANIVGPGFGGDPIWLYVRRGDDPGSRTSEIAAMSSTGAVRKVITWPAGYGTGRSVRGSDGNAWFVQDTPTGATPAPVARVTPPHDEEVVVSGTTSATPAFYAVLCGRGLPATTPADIAAASDGALWVAAKERRAAPFTLTRFTTDTPADPECQPRAPKPPAGAVGVKPVSGTVLVRVPGSAAVALDTTKVLPRGTVIDVTAGRIALRTRADAVGEFYGGAFVIAQTGTSHSPPKLRLVGDAPRCGARTAAAPPARRRKHLWGDAKGSFITAGRYGSAINTGTRWLTEDRCGGTLFRVARGVIHVRRVGEHRTVRVTAGHSYLVPRRR
jgi:streptogramin lyase